MTNWKKNVFFIWLSQFLSIMGFAFAMPFALFYMQELGVTDPDELKKWMALFAAAAPLSLGIFAPVWGAVADRFGRRLMLLRANIGAAFLLILMGSVESVQWLILCRLLQGVLTGTMTAAQTMAAAHTPTHKKGFVLGALASAVYSGAMAGQALGGLAVEAFGCRASFIVASGILAAAALLVCLGTSEDFKRVEDTMETTEGGKANRGRMGVPIVAVMILLAVASFARRFDTTFLSMLVVEIRGSTEGAALRLGWLMSLCGLAGCLSGILIGHLSGKVKPERLVLVCALFAGLMALPQAAAANFRDLYVVRFLMCFAMAGIEPVIHAWLSHTVPEGSHGRAFGWSGSARAAGWLFAPLGSWVVAWLLSVRMVFIFSGLLLCALGPVLWWAVRAGKKD